MSIPLGIISAVLENELYPTRFETFAVALMSETEGRTYLPTSRTFDLARDGRSLAGSEAGHDIIAATTSANIDSKVQSDLSRLKRTTKVRSLVYCCSQELTEHTLQRIDADLRAQLGAEAQVRVLGLVQLRDLAARHEAILEKHYRAELQDLRTALMYDPLAHDSPSLAGLRLALQTRTGDDAVELREEIARRLILEQLLDGNRHTIAAIGSSLSSRLHLPRAISSNFLSPIIESLVQENLVDVKQGKYAILPSGHELVTTIGAEAAGKLLEGKVAVAAGLEKLLGYRLAQPNFERLWPVFRDTLAELFYLHGASIIAMVAAIQSGEEWADDDGAFRVARERLADHSAAMLENHEQRAEVRQAVIDLFSTKGTPAFEWLSGTCAIYVMMCSLGLESASESQVVSVLRGMVLVPDTDIVLSLLCEGEENHEEVVRLVNGWRSLGGTLTAPSPVLEEAAYHAWFADNDYAAVRDLLPTLSPERAQYLVGNAFVRSFGQKAKDPRNVKAWTSFIDDYRGSHEYDYSLITEILSGEFGIAPMGESVSEGEARGHRLYAPLRKYLLEQAAADVSRDTDDLDDRVQDKVRRDAQLLATLHIVRARLAATAATKTAVVVSSARALRRAAISFKKEFGRPDVVVSAASVAALLALTPGVHMGVGTLRALLFDTRLAKRLNPAELFAYRMIERSDQYDLGLSRRVTLTRRLRDGLLAGARSLVGRDGRRNVDSFKRPTLRRARAC